MGIAKREAAVTKKREASAKREAPAKWDWKVVAGFLVVLGGCVALYLSYKNFCVDGDASANHRIFICAKTLKSYDINLTVSTPIPAPSPYSGQNTGYPAELCYWTKDGSVKSDPTPVLLENLKTPGYVGPTFCPDCGRLVVGHNPKPRPGGNPPPTREEWFRRHSLTAGGQ